MGDLVPVTGYRTQFPPELRSLSSELSEEKRGGNFLVPDAESYRERATPERAQGTAIRHCEQSGESGWQIVCP